MLRTYNWGYSYLGFCNPSLLISVFKKSNKEILNKYLIYNLFVMEFDNSPQLILEQYKLCIEEIEHIRDRRFRLGQFYSSILLGLIGLISLLISIKSTVNSFQMFIIFGVIGFLGVIICYVWVQHIDAYGRVNIRKLKVLYSIESQLPISPFKMESDLLKQEQLEERPWGVIKSEKILPLAFLIIFFFITVISIFFIL